MYVLCGFAEHVTELMQLAKLHQLHACDLNDLKELLKRIPSKPIGKTS